MNETLSLTNDGIEMIDYPETIHQSVEHAANAWKQFIALPDTIKNKFTADSLQTGVGYEQKKGNGLRESNDIKENFDITSDGLLSLLGIEDENETSRAFINAAGELFQNLESMICRFGQHVETTYDVPGFASEAATSVSSAFIRFLHYPPVHETTIIGEPHVDHSGFTFHLYESTGGCERLSLDRQKWSPMPVADGQAAAFASMQTQLFSHNVIRGLCHRIVANAETAKNGRIAIVCFVPLQSVPGYDRKRHGRLQEMSPGFNYQLSLEDFSAYFK